MVQADGVVPVPIDCDPSKPGNSTVASTPYPPSHLTYGGTTEGSAPGSDKVPPPTNPSEPYPPSKLKYGGDMKSDPPSAPPSKPPTNPVQSYAPPPPQTGPECVEGTVTCNPDGTWSQCGSGRNQLQGKVTPGMVCRNGIFSAASAAKVKRWIRFSELHKRHRHY
jgi:hypothetical protein